MSTNQVKGSALHNNQFQSKNWLVPLLIGVSLLLTGLTMPLVLEAQIGDHTSLPLMADGTVDSGTGG